MRYFSLFLLLSIMLGGCAMDGYEDNTTITGKVITQDGLALSATQIAVTTTDGSELITDTLTDADGNFTIDVPIGEYLVTIGKVANGGVYVTDQRQLVTDSTITLDLGNIEVKFREANIPQYSTQEGALGVGYKCLKVGCSATCWHGIPALVCGFSLCVTGFQIPLPYWKC